MKECKKHPRYKGVGKPRSLCLDCWKVWLSDPYFFRWEELSVNDIRTVMLLLGGHIQ